MAHHNTVFAQLLRLIPRHRFDELAAEHHRGRKLRSINRWSQCVALMLGQLRGRASLIDLSLAIFPWADFSRGKAAMELHVGLDHSGYLPAFVTVTSSKTGDVEAVRTPNLPRGSIVVFDRGYNSYSCLKSLNDRGIGFVTRPHRDMDATVTERREIPKGPACSPTRRSRSTRKSPARGASSRSAAFASTTPIPGVAIRSVTNIWHLAATTIAAIYKERSQVELFFKWIKQNLRIREFLGTSRNAVLTQIWIALCTYLLLAWIKFIARLGWSLQQILRVLQLNLFMSPDLFALLRGDQVNHCDEPSPPQMEFV